MREINFEDDEVDSNKPVVKATRKARQQQRADNLNNNRNVKTGHGVGSMSEAEELLKRLKEL